MSKYLDRFCDNCDEPIDEEQDTFVTTLEEDHFPNDPAIPPERINVETYKCPECGYSPVDDISDV